MDATRILARALGPFHAAIGIIALFYPPREPALPLSSVGVWPWAGGGIILLIGLTILAIPQRRSGAAALIHLLAVAMTCWGVALLAFPHQFSHVVDLTINEVTPWRVFYAALTVAGLYLSAVGWGPKRQ